VHNTSSQQISYLVRLDWTGIDGKPGSAVLAPALIASKETQLLSLRDLQNGGPLPADAHWATVSITAVCQPEDLIAMTASYDSTMRYGAQNPFSDYLGFHLDGGKWEVDATHNSISTIGNGTDDTVGVNLTLFYGNPVQKYEIVRQLGPHERMSVDFSELIRMHLPDSNGKILPDDLSWGSYRVRETNRKGFGALFEGKVIVDKTFGSVTYGCFICAGYSDTGVFDPNSTIFGISDLSYPEITATNGNSGATEYVTGYYNSWWTDNSGIASAPSWATWQGNNIGSTSGRASGTLPFSDGAAVERPSECRVIPDQANQPVQVIAASVSCPAVTRGGTVTCTASAGGPSFTTNSWKFTDSGNHTVTGSATGSTWSGTAVQGGTVSVNVRVNGTDYPAQTNLTINARTNFAFTAVNPAQLAGNSITCYGGTATALPSPPQPNSKEGFSCADLAFSFNFSTVNDSGPNNGYEYVTSASDQSGNSPTKFEYIVVSDVLSTTTFYNAQCGDFSSSNSSGFIAGSQLKQNIFNHEQGSTLSHWTEYRDAQNNSSNNIGVALESATAPPGSTGNSFAQNAGSAALNRIAQAVTVEPCGGLVINDSSQACKVCGTINYSPYQACNGQPVPHCQ
jgi:hypothetical protein